MIPPSFTEYLIPERWGLDQDLDWQVDQLLDLATLQAHGVAMIKTHLHRVCIDLNRPADQCLLHWQHNTHGEKLVLKTMERNLEQQLVQKYHRPYFDLLAKFVQQYSPRWIIDLHSMPSTTSTYHRQKNPGQNPHRPDFCISDFHGQSCSAPFMDKIITSLPHPGQQAKKNDPYFGGYITQFLAPLPVENVQIEINRKLYMNEEQRELRPEAFATLAAQLNSLLLSL